MPLLIFGAFLLIALLLYANTLRAEFLFDDYEYIVDNPLVQDLSNLHALSDPRQLGYLSFALNYAAGGDDPLGYHIVNVVIHAVNALLVLLLTGSFLRAVSGTTGAGDRNRWLPLLAASLFLVHPAQTQAVSYLTQRFTSLATLFYLLAVLLYLRSRLLLEGGERHDRGYALYALAFAATILGMRTKEITFTIPVALAALELFVFRGSSYGRRRFLYLLPFGAALLLIPLSLLGPELGLIRPADGIAEITRQDKIYDLVERPAWQYFLTQFKVLVIYLRVLLLPVGQKVIYDLAVSRKFLAFEVVVPLLLLLSLAAAGWYTWRRASQRDDAAGVRGKTAAAGIFWFFLTISVESSVIPIKDLIFEHRMYLPSAGFFAAAAAGLLAASEKLLPAGSSRRRTLLAFAVCLPLAVLTIVRNDVWSSEVKLWDDVVRTTPRKLIGYNNRGTAYAKKGRYDLALRDLDRTISLFPDNLMTAPSWEDADLIPPNISKTYLARGRVNLALGRREEADQDFALSKRLISVPPEFEETRRLADRYFKGKAYRHAIAEYSKLLSWDPANVDALNDRGNAYSLSGRYAEAVMDFDLVIRLRPDFALAYYNRGIALAWSDQPEKAVRDLEAACGMGFEPACASIDIVRSGKK
jgi:tetratricopeptide (TPR) repeat protein